MENVQRDVYYGDTCDLSKKREDKKKRMQLSTRDTSADNEMMFFNKTDILLIPSVTSVTKNFEISSEHNHTRNNNAIKSIEEIMESVSKSYRKHTHLLMKFIFVSKSCDSLIEN